MRILILNGPNLDKLHERDKNIYGDLSLSKIQLMIEKKFPDITFDFVQTDYEGELVKQVHRADSDFHGLIINPGGYAHTSVAVRDALELCKVPKIEVHLSNLAKREDFRQTLITASSCDGYITGLKEIGYVAAIESLIIIAQKNGIYI